MGFEMVAVNIYFEDRYMGYEFFSKYNFVFHVEFAFSARLRNGSNISKIDRTNILCINYGSGMTYIYGAIVTEFMLVQNFSRYCLHILHCLLFFSYIQILVIGYCFM